VDYTIINGIRLPDGAMEQDMLRKGRIEVITQVGAMYQALDRSGVL
jgi:hypothetical protein